MALCVSTRLFARSLQTCGSGRLLPVAKGGTDARRSHERLQSGRSGISLRVRARSFVKVIHGHASDLRFIIPVVKGISFSLNNEEGTFLLAANDRLVLP
ncbi:hypothetical protein SBC1_51460 (plasmid) [Caballeronia sp. SBC1]|nr:hypothetical protein SBC2_36520 [Caballeronia sp. SBC2]QIN65106.1 hypothetical protein SBC1_51460 [Caballeronia sp. SBC1]